MVSDLSDNKALSDIQNGAISFGKTQADHIKALFTPKYSYTVTATSLAVHQLRGGILTGDGKPLEEAQPDKVEANIEIKTGVDYALALGEDLHAIHHEPGTYQLGTQDSTMQIFSQNDENLIKNPDFTEGPWTAKVQDCNNYDAKPSISMSVAKDGAADGSPALKLEADRHTA